MSTKYKQLLFYLFIITTYFDVLRYVPQNRYFLEVIGYD